MITYSTVIQEKILHHAFFYEEKSHLSPKKTQRVVMSDGRVSADRKWVPLLWRGSVGGVSPPGSRRQGQAGTRGGRLGATPGCRNWPRQSPGPRQAPGETCPWARRLSTSHTDTQRHTQTHTHASAPSNSLSPTSRVSITASSVQNPNMVIKSWRRKQLNFFNMAKGVLTLRRPNASGRGLRLAAA